MKSVIRLTPKQVLRSLIWLIIFLGIIVGIFGFKARQKAEIVVTWTTASELNSIGFNLYRSENPTDQYIQINSEMIQASSDPLTGGSYSYTDSTIQPGRVYYYQLEEIDSSGNVTRNGPIEIKSVAGGSSEFILAATLISVGVLGLLAIKSSSSMVGV